jgi:hypothetical protein
MKRFLPISIWAARHAKTAIALIVLFEVTNMLIGITLGSAWWARVPTWVLLTTVAGLLICRQLLVQYAQIRLAELSGRLRYVFQRQALTGLFLLNLFTFTVAGGIMGSMVATPAPTSALHGSMGASEVKSEQSSATASAKFQEKGREKALQRMKDDLPANQTGKRIGYIALFVVGIILAYFSVFLACNLACSGYGLLAVLALLLGLGVLSGGFYSFGRGVGKDLKPYKQMTQEERKREKRRYFRTLAGTAIGIAFVWLLILFG